MQTYPDRGHRHRQTEIDELGQTETHRIACL